MVIEMPSPESMPSPGPTSPATMSPLNPAPPSGSTQPSDFAPLLSPPGLTAEERNLIAGTAELFERFMRLPDTASMDSQSVFFHLRGIQNVILARVAVRTNPELLGTDEAVADSTSGPDPTTPGSNPATPEPA